MFLGGKGIQITHGEHFQHEKNIKFEDFSKIYAYALGA